MTYIIVVIICSAGIIYMLLAKTAELNSSKTGFLGKLSVSSDPFIEKKLAAAKKILSHIHLGNARKLVSAVSGNLFHLFGTAGLFVSKHYEKIKSRARGKKTIKGGGVVSFFLKNVAESSKGEKKDLN